MGTRFVIACFRPRPGGTSALEGVLREHVPTLQRLGLATTRAPLALRAADGTLLEIFEWASPAAIDAAHGHPEVRALWQRFEAACEYVPLAALAEATQPFSEFEAL